MDYVPMMDHLYNNTFQDCEIILSTSVIIEVLYFIVYIIGLIGNTLVIYTVLRFEKMQTTNVYIVNLAIADEFFLFSIPFLITTISSHRWIFGNIMCKVYMTGTSINQFASSIFLLILSGDRYIAVCHPISSRKMRTPFISKIISVSAWIISGLFMIPIYLYTETMEHTNGVVSCNYWPNDHSAHIFTLYKFILSFIIPLTFILVFYLLVIKKLQTISAKKKSKEKKHKKVSRLVLTVIVAYVVCWLPHWVVQIALIYSPPETCQISVVIFLIADFLSYGNSALNPILYTFLSDNFKKSFLKACTCIGKNINATLNNGHSVFLRRKVNIDRLQSDQMIAKSSRIDFDEDRGLRSKTFTTTVIMTSRSDITVSSDKNPAQRKTDLNKNGVEITVTQV